MNRVALSILMGLASAGVGRSQTTQVVSVDSGGVLGNGDCGPSSISGDARFVAFSGSASNLVPGDSNGCTDVFVRDTQTGQTTRMSVDSGGVQGNADSFVGRISADARFVAFESHASNFVVQDTNASLDVFVHDRITAQTACVSVSPAGGTGNLRSMRASISGDGRWVAFESDATNLVSGDTNGMLDIFARDTLGGLTWRVSVDTSSSDANGQSFASSISADGRFVAFTSFASDLVTGDTNGVYDIFVSDRVTGLTSRVSLDSTGAQANDSSLDTAISADGRFVAFSSWADNLISGPSGPWTNIFVRDTQLGQTTLVSVNTLGGKPDNDSRNPVISGDGRYVAFRSRAQDLVLGDSNGVDDVFVRDRLTHQTFRASVDSNGVEGNSSSATASISGDGRRVGFMSLASNLVSGDTNNCMDAFVRDFQGIAPTQYCTAKRNSLGCTPAIGSIGTPSVGAGSGFFIGASDVINGKNGLFFYSHAGQQAKPFQGGFLCVKPTLERTPLQNSGGNPPPNDCSGHYSIDFAAHIASGADAALIAGAVIDGQYWARDPGFAPPNNTSLSDGIRVTLCP